MAPLQPSKKLVCPICGARLGQKKRCRVHRQTTIEPSEQMFPKRFYLHISMERTHDPEPEPEIVLANPNPEP